MLNGAGGSRGAELVSAAERARLVRLCARYCGAEMAEDLAQEALLHAWRSRDRLRDPACRPQWLAAIARNVCRREWVRRSGPAPSVVLEDVEIHLAGDASLDLALERGEVAGLLDRALGLLPAGTRDLLIERYVEDLPVGELAARHRIAEGTAAVRIHRGKRALKRLLSVELREESAALGLLDGQPEYWQLSRIWCPHCGGAHLEARRDVPAKSFSVRCPHCGFRTVEQAAPYLSQVSGYWRTLLRSNAEADRYYREALATGSASCACCGQISRLRRSIPPQISGTDHEQPGVHIRCEGCGAVSLQPDLGLVLTLPGVQCFWREHRRIRLGCRREVFSQGRDATLVRYESVAGSAAVEVVSDRATFEVLSVSGTKEAKA